MSQELGPQRLGAVIRANVVLTVAAGAFTILMSLTFAQLGWLFVAGALVLLTAFLQHVALRRLGSGDLSGSLIIYSVSSWAIALISSAIVTFQWPIQVVVAFLPTLLAATFTPEQRIVGYVAASISVALGVAAVGITQDVTGLSDEIPDWLRTLVQILVFPGFSALVILAIIQHHRRVNDLLAVEQSARSLARERATELAASRRRLIQATDRARQAIERDLHDGAQSHLIGIDLQLAQALTLDNLDETKAAIRSAQAELRRAHGELRELAHGLFPPVLVQHGLVSAIGEAVDRFPSQVRLDLAKIGRSNPEVESAVYFCVLEAMQNAVKHAPGSTITVKMQHDADVDELSVVVTDDGPGVKLPMPSGRGLDNMRDRLGAIGGTVSLESGDDGTIVMASAPWPQTIYRNGGLE